MLTVLHVVTCLSPSGGAERLVCDIATRAQGRARMLVCGAARIDSGLEEETKKRLAAVGVKTSTLAGPGRSRWWGRAAELRRIVRAESVDLVHFHTPTPVGFGLAELRPASVYTVHSSKLGGVAGTLTRAAEFLTVRMCGAVVAVSETVAIVAQQRTRLSRSCIEVIPNGISTEDFAHPRRGRQEVREALGVSESERIVALLARVDRNKSHDALIEALARMAKNGVRCVAVCAGSLTADPSWVEQLRKLAEARGISDRFRLVGVLTEPECLLGAADACVSISRSESFGLAAIEGMASGVPVVASDIPAHRETSQGGKHCRLVRPGDSVELATALSLALHGRHGIDLVAARTHVERNYHITRVTAQYLELYRKLINKG